MNLLAGLETAALETIPVDFEAADRELYMLILKQLTRKIYVSVQRIADNIK